MMQQVLNNIVLENPCRDEGQAPVTHGQRAQIMPYNQHEEQQRMGTFELEEGIRNVLACLDADCEYNLDETQDFNSNMENLIRSQNIQRGQNNIIMSAQPAAGGAQAQQQQQQQQRPGMGQQPGMPQQQQQQQQQQPGIGMHSGMGQPGIGMGSHMGQPGMPGQHVMPGQPGMPGRPNMMGGMYQQPYVMGGGMHGAMGGASNSRPSGYVMGSNIATNQQWGQQRQQPQWGQQQYYQGR